MTRDEEDEENGLKWQLEQAQDVRLTRSTQSKSTQSKNNTVWSLIARAL